MMVGLPRRAAVASTSSTLFFSRFAGSLSSKLLLELLSPVHKLRRQTAPSTSTMGAATPPTVVVETPFRISWMPTVGGIPFDAANASAGLFGGSGADGLSVASTKA